MNRDLKKKHTHVAVCKYCGKKFIAERWNVLHCSDSCREHYKWHRMSKQEFEEHLVKDNVRNIPFSNPQDYFDKYEIDVTYVSGWTNTHGKCIIKCNQCGCEYEAGLSHVIQGQITSCPSCGWGKSRTVECPVCGKVFITSNPTKTRCSAECNRKYLNAESTKTKRARRHNAKHDTGISALKLMNMEDGICYICGGKCDPADYKVVNGVFKAGRMYPSVDHVIALKNGGSDTWDNVRLAHLSCNSKKGAKII